MEEGQILYYVQLCAIRALSSQIDIGTGMTCWRSSQAPDGNDSQVDRLIYSVGNVMAARLKQRATFSTCDDSIRS